MIHPHRQVCLLANTFCYILPKKGDQQPEPPPREPTRDEISSTSGDNDGDDDGSKISLSSLRILRVKSRTMNASEFIKSLLQLVYKTKMKLCRYFQQLFPLKTMKTTFLLTQDADLFPEMSAEVEVDHNLSDLIGALEEENDVSRVSANLEDMGITDDEEKRISQGSF